MRPDAQPWDPVAELLRGGDPAALAARAGISMEDLLGRRDALIQSEAQRLRADDISVGKIGRNDPCSCGSGRKYKRCCLEKHRAALVLLSPEEVRRRAGRSRKEADREQAVRQGYGLLTDRLYHKALAWAERWLTRFPEDDRLHDVAATAALYLGDLERAAAIADARWEAAQREKAHFLAHGSHSYDDPGAPPGHAYAPQAWLERRWVARRALAYGDGQPLSQDPAVQRMVEALKRADDPARFPQQGEEGLRVRREALGQTLQAIKEAGPSLLPFLRPLAVRYSWSALLVPEILAHWGDDASIRALAEIALFHYPFLTEACLKALEDHGERSVPVLREIFESQGEFDVLKVDLISVAGNIGTPEAMAWICTLLDHAEAHVVNWAGGVLGKKRFLPALDRIRAAVNRVGPQPKLEWAIAELEDAAKGQAAALDGS
jgi:hypothetical protein